MRKQRYDHYYRRPRTTQEKRYNQNSEYTRGKRSPRQLIDAWDDRPICRQKTWKKRRKHQYRCGSRGQRHDIRITGCNKYSLSWQLQEYFETHDIPYRVKRIHKKIKVVQYYREERRCVGHKPRLITGTFDDIVNKHKIEWEPIWKWVCIPLNEPYIRMQSYLVGFQVTWWYDKDIGVEYILKQHG